MLNQKRVITEGNKNTGQVTLPWCVDFFIIFNFHIITSHENDFVFQIFTEQSEICPLQVLSWVITERWREQRRIT